MARLYANENSPLDSVLALRGLGHDVETVQETGRGGIGWPDAEVLEYATRAGRIVVTLNRRDFKRLHAQRPDHAGIVACIFNLDFAALAERIHRELDRPIAGMFVRVNRPPR